MSNKWSVTLKINSLVPTQASPHARWSANPTPTQTRRAEAVLQLISLSTLSSKLTALKASLYVKLQAFEIARRHSRSFLSIVLKIWIYRIWRQRGRGFTVAILWPLLRNLFNQKIKFKSQDFNCKRLNILFQSISFGRTFRLSSNRHRSSLKEDQSNISLWLLWLRAKTRICHSWMGLMGMARLKILCILW